MTLGQAFAKLDSQKLSQLNRRLMKRAILSKQALRVAIDSSVLEIHGQHEKSAKTVKPHTKKPVRAYKLFAAVDLVNKDLIYLKLCEGNTADSSELLSTVKAGQAFAAPRAVEMILFDKGFYKQANFNQLNQAEEETNELESVPSQDNIEPIDHVSQQESVDHIEPDQADEPAQPFVTPAKKYKTIKDAIEAIGEEEYKPYEPILTDNQRKKRASERAKTRSKREKEEKEMEQIKGGKAQIAEKWIKLTDYKGQIRLVIIKDKRMRFE